MMERGKFRHITPVSVRNYDIDWQGIVHNANYLLYCEAGRISYLQNLGLTLTIDTITGEERMVIARNEIDYISPARFGDSLSVLTRIRSIGTSSFTFEGIIEDASGGRRIAENVSVHVWLDALTGRSVRVPERFRALVRGFEGENLLSGESGPAA